MGTTLAARRNGQTLVEFALVFPIFVLVLFSIIVFGLYVFYNQQLENAAREAARYAATHSSTAQCPTVSRLDPIAPIRPRTYYRCDAPEAGWPLLTNAARTKIWGMPASLVNLTACWSGFVDSSNNVDALPSPPNVFTDCTMRDPSNPSLPPIDPRINPSSLPCPATTIGTANPSLPAADGDDKASDTAVATSSGGSSTHYPTTVTVYTCFNWTPPMAGFVFIPSQITLRGVITEVLQRQQ